MSMYRSFSPAVSTEANPHGPDLRHLASKCCGSYGNAMTLRGGLYPIPSARQGTEMGDSPGRPNPTGLLSSLSPRPVPYPQGARGSEGEELRTAAGEQRRQATGGALRHQPPVTEKQRHALAGSQDREDSGAFQRARAQRREQQRDLGRGKRVELDRAATDDRFSNAEMPRRCEPPHPSKPNPPSDSSRRHEPKSTPERRSCPRSAATGVGLRQRGVGVQRHEELAKRLAFTGAGASPARPAAVRLHGRLFTEPARGLAHLAYRRRRHEIHPIHHRGVPQVRV